MYQSLHTTVMGFETEPFEIQIRTLEMHRTAEYGIAAHWKYKEGGKGVGKDIEKRFVWLRHLLEWQTEVRDTKEFMETLKIDVFADVVFVFTPKGDVIELPAGSIPIDFAYRIHSDIGNRCIGAKVNGRIVTLDYILKNGDIVEVLTSKQANGPSRDWLKTVKTSQAKNRIRHWFKKEKREENVHRGRELLEKEFRKQGLDSLELFKADKFMDIVKRFSMNSADDLLAAIGEGVVSPLQIITKLKDDQLKLKKQNEEILFPDYVSGAKKMKVYGKPFQGVRVRGVEDVLVRFSHCCNPLPGDPIIGYITRGRGVSIHRTDCPNITHLLQEEQGRLVDVTWDENDQSTYQVEIEVHAIDRPRLTTDTMNTIADMKVQINAVRARSTRNDQATVNLKIEIQSLNHLNHIMEKIKRLKGILDVFRVTPQK
jgi:GTP pyrophosphokinase